MTTQRLAGHHALLTGADGGIGLAVTQAYLAAGALCTAVDLARDMNRSMRSSTASPATSPRRCREIKGVTPSEFRQEANQRFGRMR